MPSRDTKMDKKIRLTTVKTLKFCVYDRCGEQVVATSPFAGNNAMMRNSDAKLEHRIVTNANHSRSREEEGVPRFQSTERVYMMDTYQMTGEATLLGIVRDEKQGTAIILDRTIFHPQGGGQPSDQGTISCNGASCIVSVSMVRDVGGVIHHFGNISGSALPAPGDQASLSLDGAKRVRHAVLHSAGHAVDRAMVATAGAGVFSPSKGYHFEDSPYVEYLGVLPDGMDKTTFQGKLNNELEKLVVADMETKVEFLSEGGHGGDINDDETGAGSHVGATRIVTIAGLACPCGGTHVGSTGDLKGVQVTKLKAKKGTLRVSYTVPSVA